RDLVVEEGSTVHAPRVTLRAALPDLNAALRAVQYRPPPGWNSQRGQLDAITLTVQRLSASPALVAAAIVRVKVLPVHDPPRVTVPADRLLAEEDLPLHVQGVSVTDDDDAAGDDMLGPWLRLRVSTMTLGSSSSSSSSSGSGGCQLGISDWALSGLHVLSTGAAVPWGAGGDEAGRVWVGREVAVEGRVRSVGAAAGELWVRGERDWWGKCRVSVSAEDESGLASEGTFVVSV
ncbi:MAG: hypothetical protein ACK4ZJ_18030, partial [Allorhizobium sp.]